MPKASAGKTIDRTAKVGKPPAGKKATGKSADQAAGCDIPATKVAATAPVRVAADPLAATLAPCAEPTRKP